jgi:hypothetical protein
MKRKTRLLPRPSSATLVSKTRWLTLPSRGRHKGYALAPPLMSNVRPRNMDRALLERVLQGDPESVVLFGEAEHCAVVDWRDGFPQIVAAVAAFLPAGHLHIGGVIGGDNAVTVKGKPSLAPPQSTKQEALLLHINQALRPDFELRQFRPADGDSYSIFVAPESVWQEIDRSHPKASEKYFLSIERLAAFWSKSYFARMFSKP